MWNCCPYYNGQNDVRKFHSMNFFKKPANRTVLIIVEDKKFFFDAEQLTENSTYFEKMLNGSFKESEQREIVLEDVDLVEFQFYRDWIFGIRTISEGLDRDLLIRLILLADRFMLHQFRKECHEIIKFWLDKDISFPCRVLETSMFIGDQELKGIFVDWLYKELKVPSEKWNLTDVTNCSTAVLKFMNKTIEVFIAGIPKEVETELNSILQTLLKVINTKGDAIAKLLNEYQDERTALTKHVEDIRARNNIEDAEQLRILNDKYRQLLLEFGLVVDNC